MTKESSFKRRVRERMSKTGESYAAARTQVAQKRDRVQAAHSRLATTEDRPSDEKVVEMTGRRWEAWFSILDRWGARERKHGEMVTFLMQEHNVPSWWAQAVTMWYERERGLRLKHQQQDGFTISVSKTMAVSVEAAFDAFVNARTRRQWLVDGSMTLRTSLPGKSARFNWEDGATRVNAFFEDKGPGKVTVAVMHERLPDPDEAESAKVLWRKRLAELKSVLAQGS